MKKAEPTSQEALKALEIEIRSRFDDEKIFHYAESLKVPWNQIYAGKKSDPTFDEIKAEPGSWIVTPVPGLYKSFAHKYQREMTYPFEDVYKFARLINAIYYCYFAGNQGGKSHWSSSWVVMECHGIHPLQHITYAEAYQYILSCDCDFFKKHPELEFQPEDRTVRPKPPVHWWVVSPDLPAESNIEGGEDTPCVKTYTELTPKRNWKFARKDKIAVINKSILNFKSFDQSKKKIAGDRIDGIHWDEEPPKGFWDEGKPRIMKKKGIFLLAMTSDYGSWTWQLEQEKNNKDYIFCSMDAMNNPFIDKEYRTRLYSSMSEDEVLMRRFGKHIQMKGKVFPFDRSIHIGKPFELSNDNANYIITDWHPVKPIVTTFLSINPQNIWYVWDEAVTSEHVVDVVAQDIWQKLSLASHNVKIRKWIIDPIAKVQQVQSNPTAKPTDIITMFRRLGIRYIPGNPVFESAHTFLCQKMNLREFYINPKCNLHIEQFDTWGAKRYQKGNLEGTLRDQLEVEGNDTCVNLVYAYNGGAKYSPFYETDDMPTELPRRPATSRIYGSARV